MCRLNRTCFFFLTTRTRQIKIYVVSGSRADVCVRGLVEIYSAVCTVGLKLLYVCDIAQ